MMLRLCNFGRFFGRKSPVVVATLAGLGMAHLTLADTSFSFTAAEYPANENDTNAVIYVNRGGTYDGPVTVKVRSINGTATAGSDYQSLANDFTLTFGLDGDGFPVLTQPVAVNMIQDSLDESDETFTLELYDPSSGTIEAPGSVVFTINDASPNAKVSVSDVTVNESTSNTVDAVFTVSLNGVSGRSVKVDFETQAGTATASADFTPISGTLTFAVGETSKTVTVSVLPDSLSEGNENFSLVLTKPVFLELADATGVAQIIDAVAGNNGNTNGGGNNGNTNGGGGNNGNTNGGDGNNGNTNSGGGTDSNSNSGGGTDNNTNGDGGSDNGGTDGDGTGSDQDIPGADDSIDTVDEAAQAAGCGAAACGAGAAPMLAFTALALLGMKRRFR